MSADAPAPRWLDELPGGNIPRARLFRAPGRVNVIGEHTDYNGGLVLCTTTALCTRVAATPRDDGLLRVRSRNLDELQSVRLASPPSAESPSWIDYIRGVALELRCADVPVRGANLLIDSEIPIGGGLSSSAALEVSVALALLSLGGATLTPEHVAELCQRAEVRHAGVRCGIMDQLAVACCSRGQAMLLDCRSLKRRQVGIPLGARLLMTDSGVKHRLAEGGYNRRREECREAAALLAPRAAADALRDLDPERLEERRRTLGETLYRRCRHVVTENRRVERALEAMECSDLPALGSLISASHASLRDDFEVSCDEVEALVRIADSCSGVLGSRMVGGGFGGCVLSLVEAPAVEATMGRIAELVAGATGRRPWMHVVRPAQPAGAAERR